MRLNPFTARPNEPLPRDGDRRVVKPAGKTTIQMPGRRLSHHCYEAEWDLAAMGERDMREADARHRAGRTRTDDSRPRSGERP